MFVAPRSGTGFLARLAAVAPFDFGPGPMFSIPALEASYVADVLGSTFGHAPPPTPLTGGPLGGPSVAKPSGAPRSPSTTAVRSPEPLLRGATKIVPFLRVSSTSVAPGGVLVYEIVARNDGDTNFTATFVMNTHTPRGTAACARTDPLVCIYPGQYDGASQDPADPHLVPAQTQTAMTIPAHRERVIRTLTVQVTQATPQGTVLYNHAHVDVVGDSKLSATYLAPDVTVR
jgi:hypothetical protein